MVEILLILCVLIWLPTLFYQISHRGFLVLLIWLFIAPVASNLVNKPGSNPFFKTPVSKSVRSTGASGEQRYIFEGKPSLYDHGETVNFRDLLEPTRALFAAFLVILVVGGVLRGRALDRFDKTEVWMCAFLLIVAASVLLRSKGLAFGLHTLADAFVVPFLGYFVARRLVSSEEHVCKLSQVMMYMGAYVIIIGLIERLVHPELFYRLGGVFGDANALHVVMSVVFFMVFVDWIYSKDVPRNNQALVCGVRRFVLFLAPMIIVLTLGRGNWVGYLLSMGIFLLLGRRLVNSSRKLAAIGLTLILIPVIVIAVPAVVPQEIVQERVFDTPNVYGRFSTWEVASGGIQKYPMFGMGLNNLRDVLYGVYGGKGGYYSTVHNSWLSILLELGAVGLFVYSGIVLSFIRMGLNLYRRGTNSLERWRGIAVIAILVAYLTPALFSNNLYLTNSLTHLYVYVFVGAIAGLYGRRHSALHVPVSPEYQRQMATDVPAVTR